MGKRKGLFKKGGRGEKNPDPGGSGQHDGERGGRESGALGRPKESVVTNLTISSSVTQQTPSRGKRREEELEFQQGGGAIRVCPTLSKTPCKGET